jgi:hypothetical protein
MKMTPSMARRFGTRFGSSVPAFWLAVAATIATACADAGGGDGSGAGGSTVVDAGAGGTPVGGGGGGGITCQATCEVPGGRECVTGGFRTCTDTNGDGCAEWTQPTFCDVGDSCVEGQCADCTNDCEAGAIRCGSGGGIQDCVASADDDPCFEWGAETACPAGESCSNGVCAPASECSNECNKVGDRRCDGAGYQECTTIAADTCLHWGTTTDCPAGESCSLDECRPLAECQDECQADSRRCDAAGVSTCSNFDEDPCTEWGAAVPCEAGQVCSNGECAASCGDECGAEGQRQCSGNDFQTCGNFDGDDCLEWGLPTSCDEGQTCSNGNCRAACVNECADGTRQCAPGGAQTCGNFDDDECTEWSEAVPCDLNETCSNGVCSLQCSNECGVLNARQCSGGGFQTCGNFDEDGCLEWGVEQGCAAGQVCANGACADQCSNECAPGSVQCAGNGTQACGNFDEDACSEWAAIVPCAEGLVCSNGACQANCADECINGATRCAPGGVQTCGNIDEDACTDWGPAVPCAGDQVCSNGACAETCADECPPGATRCGANGVETCGNFDNDDCAEWSLTSPCPAGQVCSNGACAASCNDECLAGSVQCAGNGFQSCGEFDGDRCLDWSPVQPCQAGTSCSAGVCSQFCSDECNAGATRCGGPGVQVCGNFDADGCQEWGQGVPCAAGEVCDAGRCAARCQDECAAGTRRCDASGVQTCGSFDNDACTEWSAGSPCDAGEICSDGACVNVLGQCNADADCPAGLICLFQLCLPAIGCAGDADCPAGERCDVLGGGVCRRDTPSGIGDACANDADCADGQTCIAVADGGYCSQGCAAAFPCPTGSTCYVVDPETPDQGACLTDCAASEACPANQACFETGGPLGGACYLAECRNDADCATDPLLNRTCEAGLCVQNNGCDLATGEGCAAGLECWQHEGVGVCLAPCNLFDGPACGNGNTCVPVAVDGGGYCSPPGRTGVGGACTRPQDCAAGLFCVDDGVGNQSCRTLCNTGDAGACGAEVCTALGGEVGVCIGACESECNANATRCTAQGVQVCGQGDDDLCLEWLGATPCAAGQGCNDLTGACEAACRADADCADAIVPMVCQGGACRVSSQCDPATGMGCQAPDQCFLASDSGGGVCLTTCDSVAPDCPAGEACVQFGNAAYCLTPGNVPVGGACSRATDCVAGATCLDDGAGSGLCFTLCNFQAPGAVCAAGTICQDLGIDGRLGVCAATCQDECLAGSSVCSADGTGIQTCGEFDDDACLDLGPATACTDETRCNPNTVACEYYCDVDAHCPVGFGVPYQCVDNACVARECRVGNNACAPGVAGTICIPADPQDPTAGLCLSTCEPLVAGDCGPYGACDFNGDGAGGLAFTCLPAGAAQEFEACDAVRCGQGLGCLPFDGQAGTEYYCVVYCDTRTGNAGCVGQGTICEAVPDLGANIGVCLPPAP